MWKARDVQLAFGICAPAGADPAGVARMMNNIGCTLLRGAMKDQSDLDRMLAIQAGVPGFRFNWLLSAYMNDPVTLEQQWAIGVKARAAGLRVESIEDPNEMNNPDTGGGSHGINSSVNVGGNDGAKQIIVDYAKATTAWIKANWPGVLHYSGTVIAYSPDQWLADVRSVAGLVDRGAVHVYPPPGQQPSNLDQAGDAGDVGDQFHMVRWAAQALLGSPTAPMVITETGSPGGPVGQPGRVVDFYTQAITCQHCFLDGLAQGLSRIIFYYLQDGGPDAGNNQGPEAHYGWHQSDGSMKDVATQFARLMKLLADPGPDYAPAPLTVSVSGLGGTAGACGAIVPIGFADGGYLLPVWNEPLIWANNGRVSPTPVKATVSWGAIMGFVATDGINGAVVTKGIGTSVDLQMTGHPIYVRLASNRTAPPVVTPPVVPSPVVKPPVVLPQLVLPVALPLGTYTLVAAAAPTKMLPLAVVLAEDAWQGDARVTVSVDGQQILADVPITALHSGGNTQSIALGLVDGSQPHKIIIDFTNDVYGGTATTDRNVYVVAYVLGSVTTPVGQQQLGGGPGPTIAVASV